MSRCIVLLLIVLIVPVLFVSAVSAQPDLNRKNEVSVIETGSDLYRFETFTIDSNHRYNITAAIPKKQSANGFAVLYMLDGNAVLDEWNDSIFADCGENLPVLVCIGYETDLRFDVKARALDYTPCQLTGQAPPTDFKGRAGGGADKFTEIIETKIKSKIEDIVKIDKQRQGIWGHSYGGLFVLNTLFRHTETFKYYYAADPSLWYGDGLLLQHKEKYLQDIQKKNVHLTLMSGNSSSANHRNGTASVPSDAAETMFNQLKPKLTNAVFLHYELSHGAMFGKSLKESIRLFSRNFNAVH